MAGVRLRSQVSSEVTTPLPPLEAGDHLDQPTFHARYEAMPEDFRAELIEGVVYMPSPLGSDHGKVHQALNFWMTTYQAATPGTVSFDNTTTIMAPQSEPQPDACLLIVPERGGQAREQGGYLVGAPELVVEVASTTASYDLHSKRRDYERAGVREYLVVVLREPQVVWLARRGESFAKIEPGPDGILRSGVFPGLWLDPAALFRLDLGGVRKTLEQGLQSPEHADWVRRLEAGQTGR